MPYLPSALPCSDRSQSGSRSSLTPLLGQTAVARHSNPHTQRLGSHIPVYATVPCTMLQVVVGVVYNPIMEEMFTAVRGKGAFLNGNPIQASSCSSLGAALAISEIGVTRDNETLDALFGRISALTKQACRQYDSVTAH